MRLKSPLRSLAFLAILSLLLLGPLALYLARNPSQALADTFLKFDEGYGTSSAVNDSNGAVSAGSITGATWKTDDLCFDGKCLYYDGNQDFVSFGDDDDLDFAGADSFSITGWFRHGPASATNVIVAKLLGSDNNGGYRIQMEADGDITCEIEDDDANTAIDDSISSTAATYDDNRWHHFACVKSGTASLTLYIDAQQIIQDASLDGSSTLANVESLYIGIDGDGTSNDYTGFIDEIKIYRSARSASDIKADFLKNSPLEGSAASFGINDQSFLSDGLVGYWPMDEASWTNDCATDTVMDSSGNSYSGDSCPDISGPTGGSLVNTATQVLLTVPRTTSPSPAMTLLDF